MKLIKSALILEEFFIINSEYHFNEPKNNKANLKLLIKEYDIDIDFVVKDLEDDKHLIFTKVDINNQESKIGGYSMFAEGVSIFSFDSKIDFNEKQKSDFLWVSGVSISINNLRNFLSLTTAHYPLGKYILPSVDLTNLLNTKRKMLKEDKEKK